MRKLLGFTMAAIIVGAAVLYIHDMDKPPVVDPELEELVQLWRSDMDTSGVSYKWNDISYIRYVDEIPCRILGNQDPYLAGHTDITLRTIYIRRAEKYDPIHVKVILYHELAHAYLKVEDHMDEGQILGPDLTEDPIHYRDNWSILLRNYIEYVKGNR
jgi:hypothetical protein